MNVIERIKLVWMALRERQRSYSHHQWWMARAYLSGITEAPLIVTDLDYDGLKDVIVSEQVRVAEALERASDPTDKADALLRQRRLGRLLRRLKREHELYHNGPVMSDDDKSIRQILWDMSVR